MPFMGGSVLVRCKCRLLLPMGPSYPSYMSEPEPTLELLWYRSAAPSRAAGSAVAALAGGAGGGGGGGGGKAAAACSKKRRMLNLPASLPPVLGVL